MIQGVFYKINSAGANQDSQKNIEGAGRVQLLTKCQFVIEVYVTKRE